MAESAVRFLLEKLSSLLGKEVNLLAGIRDEVAFVEAELQSMRGFLRHADAIEDEDEDDGIKVWVKQVRGVAYDAEDILDEYLYRFADLHQPRRGFYGRLYKVAHTIKTMKSHRRIASQLRGIKSRVSEISDSHKRYQYDSSIILEEGSSSNIGAKSTPYELQRAEARLLQESQLVGIENPKQELVSWLLEDQISNVQVVAVVGMGGLGKTTLVSQVYQDAEVKQCFRHRAWITVSQSFNLHRLLVQIIEQLLKGIGQQIPRETQSKDIISLKEDIIAFLGDKKYLIVLDDLWSVESWDYFKNAFPANNDHGSRLMVTTRIVEVATTTRRDLFGGITFPLKPLSYEESWTLFCARTFKGKSCPHHLEESSRIILKRCMGLPLAIVTISGVLATEDTSRIDKWEKVRRSLGDEFDSNDRLRNMKKILSLSFNDLSYQLKTCFMFLSIFPEDWSYIKRYIIKLWAAQGFVEEMEGRTPEEVGEIYFRELCNRSLLQTVKENVDEEFNKFCIHDLVRDFILKKSKEQNFVAIASEQNPILHESVRHLFVSATLEDLQGDKNNFSRLHSLLLLNAKGSISGSSMSALFSKYGGLRLLKVLDCRGLPLDVFPECVTKLYNLRYLNLRGTKVASIPRSIGRLRYIEILNLAETLIEELPTEIAQLHHLRFVIVFHTINDGSFYGKTIGARVPKETGKLTSLQHLSVIQASEGCLDLIKLLGNLKQLRFLSIQRLGAEHGPALCSSIEKLSYLCELGMEAREEPEILEVQGMSSPPQCLQRLVMYGRLEMLPHWVPKLSSLVSLQLRWSKLELDPLESLQALPSLQHLEFEKAYDGEELCFRAGAFQILKSLVFCRLGRLRKVKVEQGAIPRLQSLWLEDCKSLEEVPSGVEFLTHLKELDFINMGDQLLTRLSSSIQDSDFSRVKHVPNEVVVVVVVAAAAVDMVLKDMLIRSIHKSYHLPSHLLKKLIS
ncbi:hypothetical protein TIFTF001_024415 [Ficus carica]|uniref:Uncharacterized protein n=1 Tax=Ficus carica TaxID=3494 RepID=A0AA88AVP3_FICCA|nr:hypothetical protein TIFTF001_024415 [Ficus carica]